MTGQFADHSERARSLQGKFRHRQISKFARDLPGIQEKADVCRGHTRGNLKRLFLQIVWNQPVVFRSTEFSEVTPGADSGAAQKQSVLLGRLGARGLRRTRIAGNCHIRENRSASSGPLRPFEFVRLGLTNNV